MRLEELNWKDVEKYLEQDDRLILCWALVSNMATLAC